MSKPTTPKDGIANPSGAAVAGIAPFLFAAGVPVTSYLTQPGGLFEKALNGFVSTIAYVGTAGAFSTVSASAVVPTLAVAYIFGVYALGGATSAAAIEMSSEEGRDNGGRCPPLLSFVVRGE